MMCWVVSGTDRSATPQEHRIQRQLGKVSHGKPTEKQRHMLFLTRERR